METQLYFFDLITPSADKLRLVVEARNEDEARVLAETEAKRRGDLDDDDLADPDAEVCLSAPELISPATGTPGIRLSTD